MKSKSPEAHPYQKEAINFILNSINTTDVLLAAAPNAGKTFMSSIIISDQVQKGKRILCSIHGTNILKRQFYNSLIKIVDKKFVSMYDPMKKYLFDPSKPIQIVIHQNKKQVDECVEKFGKFDLFVVDEAHKYYDAPSVQHFEKNCVDGKSLLLTGSPEIFKSRVKEGKLAAYYISVEEIESCTPGQYERNLETFIYTNDIMLGLDDFNVDGEVKNESKIKINKSNNTDIIKKLLVGDFGKTIIYVKTRQQSQVVCKNLGKADYSVLLSNYEDDKESESIREFKELSGNHILIVVDRCSEGYDDPNVSIIDMTYTKNIGLTYQRYSRAIRAPKGDFVAPKRFIKIVPNDQKSAEAYTHIMTAVKMLLRAEYYKEFNGKNFSIPTIKDIVVKTNGGCGSPVIDYISTKKIIVNDINAVVETSKSNKPRTIEDLSNDDKFKVTVVANGNKYQIKSGEFKSWADKLEGGEYTIEVEKTKNNIDNNLLMETATLSGVYFDRTNENFDIITKYATSRLDKVLADIYEQNVPNGYWKLELCKDKSIKYLYIKDWRKNDSASYNAAHKNGWIDECTTHMTLIQLPNGYWTLEKCKEDALNYKTIKEWRANNATAYGKACRNGWLDECTAHMEITHKKAGYWNDIELCRQEALKYSNISDFIRNASSAYNYSVKNGWLEEITSHMISERKKNGYWNILENVLNDAKKYETLTEWGLKSASAVNNARKNGWLDECTAHMKKRNQDWTLEKCKEISLKYTKSTVWRKENKSCYNAAYKNKWINECTAHMKKKK